MNNKSTLSELGRAYKRRENERERVMTEKIGTDEQLRKMALALEIRNKDGKNQTKILFPSIEIVCREWDIFDVWMTKMYVLVWLESSIHTDSYSVTLNPCRTINSGKVFKDNVSVMKSCNRQTKVDSVGLVGNIVME